MLSRRSFGKGAVAVSMPRRPDQAYVPPSAVLPPQSQSGIFARVVVGNEFVINKNGAFFYSPSIGAGNLDESITATSGTDPYGNHYLAGTTTYGTGVAVNIINGTIQWYTGSLSAGWTFAAAYAQYDSAKGSLELASPIFTTVFPQLVVATAIPATRQTSATAEIQGSISTTGTLEAVVSGAVETWHNASLSAGFAAFGSGFATPGYQYEPVNGGRVRLRGLVQVTAAEAGSVTMFTLPAGYRPVSVQSFTTAVALSGLTISNTTTVQVNTLGNVGVVPSDTGTGAVGLDGIVIELD